MPSVHRMITLIIHTSHMRDWNSTSALMVLLCGTVATHIPVRLTRTQPVMFTSCLCCPSGEGQRGQLQKIGIKQPLLDLYDWMNSPKWKKQELKSIPISGFCILVLTLTEEESFKTSQLTCGGEIRQALLGKWRFFKVPFSCAVRKRQDTALLSFQPRMGNALKWPPSGGGKGGGLCTVEMT